MSSDQAQLPRHTVKVDDVCIGGDHPVVVQSMTNTDTADIDATANQVAELAQARRHHVVAMRMSLGMLRLRPSRR